MCSQGMLWGCVSPIEMLGFLFDVLQRYAWHCVILNVMLALLCAVFPKCVAELHQYQLDFHDVFPRRAAGQHQSQWLWASSLMYRKACYGTASVPVRCWASCMMYSQAVLFDCIISHYRSFVSICLPHELWLISLFLPKNVYANSLKNVSGNSAVTSLFIWDTDMRATVCWITPQILTVTKAERRTTPDSLYCQFQVPWHLICYLSKYSSAMSCKWG